MAKKEKVKVELTKQYQIKGVLIKMEWIKQEKTMKALFGDNFDIKVKLYTSAYKSALRF